jgi:uncharacterized membrane protein
VIGKIVAAVAMVGFAALSVWLGVLADVGNLPAAEVWGNKFIGGIFGLVATLIFLSLILPNRGRGSDDHGSKEGRG